MQRFWSSGRWLRAIFLFGLGALAGLGQAPTEFWPVTVLAFSVALFLTSGAERRVQAASIWFFTGLGYFTLSLRWIIEPFLVDIAAHGWMAPFALALMASGAALFWALAGALAWPRGGMLTLVAGLTLVEALRGLILSGFPWALAGHIWIETPLAQVAAYIGPHGLSFLTFALAGSLSLLLKARTLGAVLPLAAIAGWVWFSGQTEPTQSQGRPLVRIVHPNIPQAEKWDPALRAVNFDRMIEMTQSPSELGALPDVVVWPESAVTQLLENATLSLETLSEAAQGASVITGIQRRERDQIYHNSFAVLGRGGAVSALYDKQHLVPFGEYFPGGEIASRLGLRGLASSEGGGFTSGTGATLLSVPGLGTIRPLICYEAIFAEEVRATERRPDVMVLITNDAWFGRGPGPLQHLRQAQLRAIELGIPMIRAANAGVSAVIDGRGRIQASMGLDDRGVLDAAVPEALEPTMYARLGDVWTLVCIFLISIAGTVRRPSKGIDVRALGS